MSNSKPRFLPSLTLDGEGDGRKTKNTKIRDWSSDQHLLWIYRDLAELESTRWLSEEADLPQFVIDPLRAGETRPRSVAGRDGRLGIGFGGLLARKAHPVSPGRSPA